VSTNSDQAAWEGFDEVADVVVAGSGTAAFAAAIAAAQRGCEVVMLEKAATLGGTTAKSSATMWIPNNPLMRRYGLVDDRAAALRYLARAAYPAAYYADHPTLGLAEHRYRLLEAFYDNGSAAFEELDEAGAIPYDPHCMPGFPDYHADYPEDEAPVGRSIKMWLPPDYTFGADATGGQRMIDAMQVVAEKLGVRIRTNARVVRVVRDDSGAVVAVEAHVRTTTRLVGARKGVVFGTGGFLHDPAKAEAFLRGPVFGGSAVAEATGDFVDIAGELGARLDNMSYAWWDQVVLESALRARSTSRDAVYPAGDSMMIVNRHGRRVMNEKMPYNERGQVHLHWDADRRSYENLLLFMVFDEATARDPRPVRHRYPTPLSADSEGDAISAGSWPELAEKIGARLAEVADRTGGFTLADDFASGLVTQVARFDDFALSGVDLDHGRGEAPIERAWAPPPRFDGQPNPTMHPFAAEGPFYCLVLAPGALDTKGGPATDSVGRVLAGDGTPIPGLYGAGNCVASPTGQGYFGAGGTVGPALTFGWLAGVDVAGVASRTPSFDGT
jgi:3-oxosteroid 1-dehydrogenase